MSVRILVVDNHPLVRQGIRAVLEADTSLGEAGEFTIVDEAGSGAEAIAAVEEHRPDVVLLDLTLPDRPALETCSAILLRHPHAAVIVLSGSGDEPSAGTLSHAGARGYLVKDAEELDLPDAIRRVLAGETVIRARGKTARPAPRAESQSPKLTEQELNVLRSAAEGLTNPEIGARLGLSRHTVKEYLSHAMRKLEAVNRVEAVRKAGSLGLLEGTALSAGDRRHEAKRELIYSDADGRAEVSDLKVPPLKMARLREDSTS